MKESRNWKIRPKGPIHMHPRTEVSGGFVTKHINLSSKLVASSLPSSIDVFRENYLPTEMPYLNINLGNSKLMNPLGCVF